MASNKTKSIELFRVAGVQVEIDYSWLVIFSLVLWSLSAGYFPQEYPGQPTARLLGRRPRGDPVLLRLGFAS